MSGLYGATLVRNPLHKERDIMLTFSDISYMKHDIIVFWEFMCFKLFSRMLQKSAFRIDT